MSRSLKLFSSIAASLSFLEVGRAAPPTWDHIVIVIEENHAFSQVIGDPIQAPYINNTLKAGGASLADMYGITHPSQPNYLQFFSGANQGVTDNVDTSSITPFNTANLGAEVIAAGRTFTGFSENLPYAGYTGFEADGGLYARRHNPWVQWQSNDAPASNHLAPTTNQPFSAFPTTPAGFAGLPSVSIVVPNNDNNMHDGTILQGDTWLQNNLGAYAAWAKNNNSLLVVTFDEDNSGSRNRIPTVFYGANVVAGATVNGTWTLHNLLHTVEAANGTSHAGSSADLRPIVGAFTTDVVALTTTFRQGVSGYTGATDTYIESANPGTAHGSDVMLVADGSPQSQGLIRFDSLFGAGAGQVPLGANILSAKLSILTGTTANDESLSTMSLHQLNVPFSSSSTWTSLGSGVSLGAEAVTTPEFSLLPNKEGNYGIFDVTDSIAAFAAAAALGSNINYGWLINPSGTDGWRFRSSEYATVGDRPILSITYALPGDYNHNNIVDAADYVVWRKTFGQTGTGLAADGNNNGSIDNGDYDFWRARFGQAYASGAAFGSAEVFESAVPEPATTVLLVFAAAVLYLAVCQSAARCCPR
jgi:phosphatidylinositol-3-phosphatase